MYNIGFSYSYQKKYYNIGHLLEKVNCFLIWVFSFICCLNWIASLAYLGRAWKMKALYFLFIAQRKFRVRLLKFLFETTKGLLWICLLWIELRLNGIFFDKYKATELVWIEFENHIIFSLPKFFNSLWSHYLYFLKVLKHHERMKKNMSCSTCKRTNIANGYLVLVILFFLRKRWK